MAMIVDRSVEGRVHRTPDVFLSHSARDKEFVRTLAEDLACCEVDVWLDEWELQTGENFAEVIRSALKKSRFVAVALGDNYADSMWVQDEMSWALERGEQEGRVIALPLLCGSVEVPPLLKDKLFLDFRTHYFPNLVRLAAIVHNVPRQHIEDAIRAISPIDLHSSIETLRYVGVEPYVIMSKEDTAAILQAGGQPYGEERVRFSPDQIAQDPYVSPRLRRIMQRLIKVWRASVSATKEQKRGDGPNVSTQRRIK